MKITQLSLKNNLKIKILDKDKLEIGKFYIMLLMEKILVKGNENER
jgi:hypothetical protein